jgi:DNA-binding CsgD family transcriptional regulator
MRRLLSFITDVYELANRAPSPYFPGEAVHLLRGLLAFDAARWGSAGAFCEEPAPGGAILSLIDERPHKAIPCALDAGYDDKRMQALQAFTASAGLQGLILLGQPAGDGTAGRWLVLGRCAPRHFKPGDAALLESAWPHLLRAISINLRLVLEDIDMGHKDRACGLLNAGGLIEAADPQFYALLRREWPGMAGLRLPEAAWTPLRRGVPFHGTHIEISARPAHTHLLCIAQPLSPLHRLSPLERSVAERFAAGKGSKEIARELHTSPHTVRNHLSHLYRKLNVHDKAELASLVLRARALRR